MSRCQLVLGDVLRIPFTQRLLETDCQTLTFVIAALVNRGRTVSYSEKDGNVMHKFFSLLPSGLLSSLDKNISLNPDCDWARA